MSRVRSIRIIAFCFERGARALESLRRPCEVAPRERYLGLKRLRDTPVAAIATMADDEENPDAPVAEEARAA